MSNLVRGLLASLPVGRCRVGSLGHVTSSCVGPLLKDLQEVVLQSFGKSSSTLREIVVVLVYHTSSIANTLIVYVG